MKIENFSREGYERSKVWVDLFCAMFNQKYGPDQTAKNNDSNDKHGADIVVFENDKLVGYIEHQASMPSDLEFINIYERRLKKSYDKPCKVVIQYKVTNEVFMIGFDKMKSLCLTAPFTMGTRRAMGKDWEEKIYQIPKTEFKKIQLEQLKLDL